MSMSPRFRFHARPDGSLTTGTGRSGRRLVVGGVLGLLVLWGLLYLAFARWREEYRARAEFGRTAVAPAIDPLAEVVPPDVDPRAWAEAVAGTHDLLDRLVGANVLTLAAMEALRDDLADRVTSARERPDRAGLILVGLWVEMEAKAGPALAGAPRPRLLAPALALEPLARSEPPDLDRVAWRSALDETRLRLVEAAGRRPGQADELAEAVAARARIDRPDQARAALAALETQVLTTTP